MRSILAHQGRILGLAYSPDGQWLASTDTRGNFFLWDTMMKEPRKLPLPPRMPSVPMYGVAFSPNGRFVAVTCEARHTDRQPEEGLILWDLTSLDAHFISTGRHSAYQVAFHPSDDAIVATCFQDSARLTRRELPWGTSRPFAEPRPDIWQTTIAPNGRWVAGAGNHSTIHIWDWADGRIVGEGGSKKSGTIESLAFHPSSQMLVGMGSPGAWLWNWPSDWRRLNDVSRFCDRIGVFTPEGRSFLTAGEGKGVRVWDTETWTLRLEYTWEINGVDRMVVAPDGTRAALGTEYGALLVWDLE